MMAESNDEIARRVLASALERLEAGRGVSSHHSAGAEQVSRPSSITDPVIVLVLGQGNQSEAPLANVANDTHAIHLTASHPGLEKFELPKTASNASAPKTCFMEPDRPCINSGACETRGY